MGRRIFTVHTHSHFTRWWLHTLSVLLKTPVLSIPSPQVETSLLISLKSRSIPSPQPTSWPMSVSMPLPSSQNHGCTFLAPVQGSPPPQLTQEEHISQSPDFPPTCSFSTSFVRYSSSCPLNDRNLQGLFSSWIFSLHLHLLLRWSYLHLWLQIKSIPVVSYTLAICQL